MTTLMSWKANDSRGISSIYITSDSRFTWNNIHWDYGQKVYGCTNFAEIIGYCGDVLLSISIISSLISLIDNEIIYKNDKASDYKNDLVFKYIKEKFMLFPKNSDTVIIHVIKDINNQFSYYEMKYILKEKRWENIKKEDIMNKESCLIDAYGSGANEYKDNLVNSCNSELNKTSRFYYMIFCDTLHNIKDRFTGGASQIIGLYRGKKCSIPIGTVWDNERFLYGMKVEKKFNIENLEWRNENFERYEANKNTIISGAQKQPRPRNK